MNIHDCMCGGDMHVVENLCDPHWTKDANPMDRVLHAWCRQLQVVCSKCDKRFGNWHYGTMFEDSASFYREDAMGKLIREWNKYVETNSTVSTNG